MGSGVRGQGPGAMGQGPAVRGQASARATARDGDGDGERERGAARGGRVDWTGITGRAPMMKKSVALSHERRSLSSHVILPYRRVKTCSKTSSSYRHESAPVRPTVGTSGGTGSVGSVG